MQIYTNLSKLHGLDEKLLVLIVCCSLEVVCFQLVIRGLLQMLLIDFRMNNENENIGSNELL